MIILKYSVFYILVVWILVYSMLFIRLQDYENDEISLSDLVFIFLNLLVVFGIEKYMHIKIPYILFAVLLISLHESCLSVIIDEISSYTDFEYKFHIKNRNILSCIFLIIGLLLIDTKIHIEIVEFVFLILTMLSSIRLMNSVYHDFIKQEQTKLKPILLYLVLFLYHLILTFIFAISQ